MKILIVDDDRLSRVLLSRALEKAGYGTEQVESAEAAMGVLRSGEPIILMICDLTMPGTDGMAFLAGIRSTPWLAELPILVCTAQDPARWYDAADCLGISGHLTKPLNAQDLIERVGLVLDAATVPIEEGATIQRRLQISAEDYVESLEGLEKDLEDVRERVDRCTEETDLERLETSLDGLAGAASSLGALRLGPVLKSLSETCRDREVLRIKQNGAQLARELRILRSALEVVKQEQARFKDSSKDGNYYLPMARGMIWKQFAHKNAEAISK